MWMENISIIFFIFYQILSLKAIHLAIFLQNLLKKFNKKSKKKGTHCNNEKN